MKRRNSLTIVFTLGVLLAACQPAASELSEADVTAIKAKTDRYVAAALASDWDVAGKELSSDIVFLPPNAAPVVGHDAAMTYLRNYPKITGFTVNVDEVRGRGDLAYARGTYMISVELPDKSAATENGAFLETHRKQADGTWRYAHIMWHSMSPPPAPPAATKKE